MGQYEKITLGVEDIEISPSSSRAVEVTLTCSLHRLCNELVETPNFFDTMAELGWALEESDEKELSDWDDEEIIDYLEGQGYSVKEV